MMYGPRTDETAHSARAHAEHARTLSVQNDKAVQVVASQASGLDDCLELLAMLGLDAQAARVTGPRALR
ncbi:MAG TPA: hypothetical protein VGH89_20895 [Pseudonocardia sp.]